MVLNVYVFGITISGSPPPCLVATNVSSYDLTVDNTVAAKDINVQIVSDIYRLSLGDFFSESIGTSFANTYNFDTLSTTPLNMKNLGEDRFLVGMYPGGRIYKTWNNGSSWSSVTNLSGIIIPLLVKKHNQAVYCGGGSNTQLVIYKSADNGDTWINQNITGTVFTNASGMSSYIYAGSNIFLASQTYGDAYSNTVFISTGGVSWVSTGQSFPTALYIEPMDSDGSGVIVASGYYDGMYRSTNFGLSWIKFQDNPTTNCSAVKYLGDKAWIYTYGKDTIYRSLDNGVTWKPPTVLSAATTDPVEISTIGGGIVFLTRGSKGVGISVDWGNTWTDYNAISSYRCTTLCANEKGIIVAVYVRTGSYVPRCYISDIFYRYTKDVSNFRPLPSSPAPRAGTIYYGQDNVFYKCTNGTTWVPQ
jgi:hypothetical protein